MSNFNKEDEFALYRLSSGRYKDGSPRAASTLLIVELKDSEALEYKSTSFESAPVNLIAGDGHVVVEANFSGDNLVKYEDAKDILAEWMQKRSSIEFATRFLTFTVVPFELNGAVYLNFYNLSYFIAMQTSETEYRIVMVFGLSNASVARTDDINVSQIEHEMNIELDQELNQLDEEAAQIEAYTDEIHNAQVLNDKDRLSQVFDDIDATYGNVSDNAGD